MIKILLPTAEIIRDHGRHEGFFNFYEEGLRGVVRDMVLMSDDSIFSTSIPQRQLNVSEGLIQKILREYQNSPEAVMQRYLENTTYESYVELIAEMIADSVHDMMRSIFVSAVYDVSKTEWDWLGNDLITRIRIYR